MNIPRDISRSRREERAPVEWHIALKALAFAVIVPGTVIVFVPYLILSGFGRIEWPGVSLQSVLSGMLAMLGIGLLGHSIWGFAVLGHGTPAPIDPPKELVIRGLYSYTRNPMYHGVLLTLAAESLFFRSTEMLLYSGAIFLGFHLFVILFEEPTLRARFGREYEEYRRAVPRWGVALRKFERKDTFHDGGKEKPFMRNPHAS
jgi:protein-S-isoprenylcysteine O-methyltransferase Ste14